jgi:beta-phosphoglucomutase
MKQPFAFLFDMDGVIVDSNPAHKIALKKFCLEHGHDLTEDQLKEKIYGRTNKDWIPVVFGEISAEKQKQYAREKEALFRELYKPTIKPLNGLVQFLRKLDEQHYERAIATSAPRENVDFTLDMTGTASFFSTILDESFVSKGKPDPEIYIKSARALGYPAENCIVLEDSLSGVAAGKAAGCKVVAFTTTHGEDELSNADVVIKDFRDLEPSELVFKLFGRR